MVLFFRLSPDVTPGQLILSELSFPADSDLHRRRFPLEPSFCGYRRQRMLGDPVVHCVCSRADITRYNKGRNNQTFLLLLLLLLARNKSRHHIQGFCTSIHFHFKGWKKKEKGKLKATGETAFLFSQIRATFHD